MRGRTYKVSVCIEPREDGGLRIWSPDVPELVLSHHDHALVLADISPALEFILEHKLGAPVRVRELTALSATAEPIAEGRREYAALAA